MMRRPLPKIWLSYGCMICVFAYFSDMEVLQLQLINRDSYARIVVRCQYVWRIPKMSAFTIADSDYFSKCILLVNDIGGEPQKFEDDRLDFSDTKTVLVNKELYVFTGGKPVSVYKVAHFNSSENLVKIALPALSCNDFLDNFAVSFVAGNIYLTGGYDGLGWDVFSVQTYLMDVQTDKWLQKSLPKFTEARAFH